MFRHLAAMVLAALAFDAFGDELRFDFRNDTPGKAPAGFTNATFGVGQARGWVVSQEEVPPANTPPGASAPIEGKRNVLAQLGSSKTDEHFPVLIYEKDRFGDFKFKTRFKNAGGELEQMAGVAFRILDQHNYYYVRASSLGNTFRFFKTVNGQRSVPIGPEISIPSGVWHELQVECKGNRITCSLNGKEVIPTLTDNSFSSGKIGFWTKSDSVVYFADASLEYTPREPMAQSAINGIMKKYPRLEGLAVYGLGKEPGENKIVASTESPDIGKPGGKTEADVIARDTIYYGKDGGKALVTMPLRDRNGDTVAAIRVTLKSFKGQTERNAIARALPLVQEIQLQVRSAEEFLE